MDAPETEDRPATSIGLEILWLSNSTGATKMLSLVACSRCRARSQLPSDAKKGNEHGLRKILDVFAGPVSKQNETG